MVTTSCDDPITNPWSFSTNWTIAAGSLSSVSIAVESSDSPIDDSETPDKSPLLLTPPSPDSGPCEITISFAQKREVQQVYVRSTARVYEIYSTRSFESSNDYLCTVRCGIATRDDEVLHAAPTCARLKEFAGQQGKEKFSNSDDDWVEVKGPDLPLQDDQLSLGPERISANPQTNSQDLYEATAEFTDPDACTSLTLRLLSLQSKGCVNIDEIYVFADPAETADSETQAAHVGNSATSSLMSMLLPTLLQISRAGNSQSQDKHAPRSSGIGEFFDVGPKVNDSSDFGMKIQQEVNVAISRPHDLQIQAQDSDLVQGSEVFAQSDVSTESGNFQRRGEHAPSYSGLGEYVDVGSKVMTLANDGNEAQQEVLKPAFKPPALQIQAPHPESDQLVTQIDVFTNRIENVLEQLVTRVSRIEDICVRFEENMAKPIRNIEQRLQLVEEQVQVLAKNSFHSRLSNPTRIYAPEFSSGDSTSTSFYNEGNENPACSEQVQVPAKNSQHFNLPSSCIRICAPEFSCDESNSGSFYKDAFSSDRNVDSEKADISSKEVPYASNANFHPSLVITAPDFSCFDDEGNRDGYEEAGIGPGEGKVCGDDETKKDAVEPIDDFQQEKPRQNISIDDALAAALAEFIIMKNGDDETQTKQNKTPSVTPFFCSKLNRGECNSDITSDYQTLTMRAPEFIIMENGDDETQTKQIKTPSVTPIFCSEVNRGECSSGDMATGLLGGDNGQDKLVSTCVTGQVEHEIPRKYNSAITDSTFLGEPHHESAAEPVSVKDEIVKKLSENTEMEFKKDILENVIGSPSDSFLVNFELPILDVKFASCDIPSTAASVVEALSDDFPEFVVEASSTEQKNGDEIVKIVNSIANIYSTDSHILSDYHGNNASVGPSSLDGEALNDSSKWDGEDLFGNLLF